MRRGCFANTPIQFDGLIHVDIQAISVCTSALACFLRVEEPRVPSEVLLVLG